MRLIPDVEPHMQGRRDYVSEDGQWKLSRERVKYDIFRWRVQSRNQGHQPPRGRGNEGVPDMSTGQVTSTVTVAKPLRET